MANWAHWDGSQNLGPGPNRQIKPNVLTACDEGGMVRRTASTPDVCGTWDRSAVDTHVPYL